MRLNRHRLAFGIERDQEAFTSYTRSMQTLYSPLEITQVRGSLVNALNEKEDVEDFDNVRYLTSKRFDDLFS